MNMDAATTPAQRIENHLTLVEATEDLRRERLISRCECNARTFDETCLVAFHAPFWSIAYTRWATLDQITARYGEVCERPAVRTFYDHGKEKHPEREWEPGAFLPSDGLHRVTGITR